MARRKKRKSRKRPRQSLAALKQNGLKAFNRGDYDRAIQSWTKNPLHATDKRLLVAIAEAHFRMGLRQTAGSYEALQSAVTLQPDNVRYRYHLGLAAHRLERLSEAIEAYEHAYRSPEWSARVAYPLALALHQSQIDMTQAPVWNTLTGAEREMLTRIQTFRRLPYQVEAGAAPLWRGLAALGQKRYAEAETHLAETAQVAATAGISHYYLGVIAAQADDWEKVAHHWSVASRDGFHSPRLVANLGELYHRLAEERAVKGDIEGALLAATEATNHKEEDKQLQNLLSYLAHHAAYQAAQKGEWKEAMDTWEIAQDKGGKTFRLSYNLALAYEKLERYFEAAEQWRQTLRRRPRKADHPDAINDEQIGRLWQRAAEAYVKAGEYDKAIHVYKQAVKWQPDNLTMRLALADGLLNNGQFQAALNELERILDRNPDYVPALIKAGETHSQYERWWYHSSAVGYWERALAIEPDNEVIRQYLADFFMDRAEYRAKWGSSEEIIDDYKQVLRYHPDNGFALAELAYVYYTTGAEEETETYIERALQAAPTNEDVYERLVIVRLLMEQVEKANELARMAEANVANLSPFFYMQIVSHCLLNQQLDVAEPWLARAVELAPPDMPILVIIGERLASVNEDLAIQVGRDYLRQAIQAGQHPGQAHLMLGVIAAREQDMRAAKKEWRQAKIFARRTKDRELMERIEAAEAMFTPPFGFLSQMLAGGLDGMPFPPNLGRMLGEMLDDDFF